MSDTAIRVDGLGKRYRIGAQVARYRTLREALVDAVGMPLRRISGALRGRIPSNTGREIWALRDVSFEIGRGEVVGVIGRNGAGKTTLLKILSRITKPTLGSIDLYGRVGSLLEVGTGFHPELTGRENIYLNGAIIGMKKAEIDEKFDDIVEFAEIGRFLDTPLKHYSSGMYVRLAFSVAAHMEPDILLVDEVLSVGDASFQKKSLGRMSQVAAEGRTVLFVSHNIAAITALTRRCILLKEGGLELDDETSVVTARYLADSASGTHDGVVDLRKGIRRKPDYPLQIHLTELMLTDSNGFPREQFYYGDPITLTISFDVKRPIRQFGITCNISTLMGTRLFSIVSGKQSWVASPGSYTVSTVLDPNPLRPGIYALNLGIESSVWQDGGYDVASFEIVDNPNQQNKNYPTYGNFGVFYLPYKWGDPTPRKEPAQNLGGPLE